MEKKTNTEKIVEGLQKPTWEITTPMPKEEKSIDKCYLTYGEDGHLTCANNHKEGEECLMNEKYDDTPPNTTGEEKKCENCGNPLDEELHRCGAFEPMLIKKLKDSISTPPLSHKTEEKECRKCNLLGQKPIVVKRFSIKGTENMYECKACGSHWSTEPHKTWEEDFDKMTEEYIENLPWSNDAKDYEKTLVIGNIRGFAGKIKRDLGNLPSSLISDTEKEAYRRGENSGIADTVALAKIWIADAERKVREQTTKDIYRELKGRGYDAVSLLGRF
jgi:hypothetical protein